MEQKILAALARKNYAPVKPKALARKLGVTNADYPQFRQALRDLVKQGRAQFGLGVAVRCAPHPDGQPRPPGRRYRGAGQFQV